MKHKGWAYAVAEDDEPGDPIKLTHMAIKGKQVVELDLSPYLKVVPEDVFQTLINLGFPTRKVISSIGPMEVKEVRNLEMEHHNAKTI